jgi:hypothetical protein
MNVCRDSVCDQMGGHWEKENWRSRPQAMPQSVFDALQTASLPKAII